MTADALRHITIGGDATWEHPGVLCVVSSRGYLFHFGFANGTLGGDSETLPEGPEGWSFGGLVTASIDSRKGPDDLTIEQAEEWICEAIDTYPEGWTQQ